MAALAAGKRAENWPGHVAWHIATDGHGDLAKDHEKA